MRSSRNFLYFIDRASRYKFLLIANLTNFFVYLFTSSLYLFQASQCSSSGDRIVLIHHLVCFLYFIERASRYKLLLTANLTNFFMYLFTPISLHVSSITVLIIRRSNCINPSSGMFFIFY